jgi:hypothetical protein
MKKTTLILLSFVSLFCACKHEPFVADFEYFNQAATDKIATYANGYLTSSHGVFTISSGKDSSANDQLTVGYHIEYNHTLDAIQVDKSDWTKLAPHFGGHIVTTSLSSDKSQVVAFKIRSTTPQNEVMNGEVTVPRQTPLSVADLGNNTFKITWAGQNRRARVLIAMSPYHVYDTPYYQGNFAVETEDDGEYILMPTVFEKFEKNTNSTSNFVTSRMQIHLMRNIPNTKVSIKQPSSGKEYTVYGGYTDGKIIDVIKIK